MRLPILRAVAAFLWLAMGLSVAINAQARDTNEVVLVGTTDPDMVAAIRHARSTLSDFLVLASAPRPGTDGYKLKVMIRDGDAVEHFWVSPFRVEAQAFAGVLANEPRLVKNVRGGQIVRFKRDEISDWGYVQNGRQVGSFTVCAMFKKVPAEQADYYRKNHGFDC